MLPPDELYGKPWISRLSWGTSCELNDTHLPSEIKVLLPWVFGNSYVGPIEITNWWLFELFVYCQRRSPTEAVCKTHALRILFCFFLLSTAKQFKTEVFSADNAEGMDFNSTETYPQTAKLELSSWYRYERNASRTSFINRLNNQSSL